MVNLYTLLIISSLPLSCIYGHEENEVMKEKKQSSYRHLKWPAIVLIGLIILLVVVMDHCSRNGQI